MIICFLIFMPAGGAVLFGLLFSFLGLLNWSIYGLWGLGAIIGLGMGLKLFSMVNNISDRERNKILRMYSVYIDNTDKKHNIP
ncbi:MAG: hypothetical protein GY855_08780 [candidate division Zixibacteria bacterium]|nr:hypothetical protein [candidate division Zixibacteria bacterium]